MAEVPSPSSLSRKAEYNLWHPNPMSDEAATVPGRSTGQRRRGDGAGGGRRANSDLGGHRVGGGADNGRRPDGGDAVDGGRMNRTQGRTPFVSWFKSKFI